MIGILAKSLLSTMLSVLLVIATTPFQARAQSAPTGYSGQGAPLSPSDLQQLVAPIALYPDALVAQILGASTFPDQVASADGWLQQNKNLTGAALMQAVDASPWDPSVKALTQFPSVLDNLAKNLSWTSSLGEAYNTQSADIMSAIQVLRAKAQAAGNLKSGSQIVVVQQSPQTIVIQSANPQVIYVPVYNPTVVYGYPYVTPGYSTAAVVTTGVIAFGVGVAVGIAMSNNSWGYSYWNCNWHGGAVLYRSNSYYGNNAWRGGYYGSTATAYGPHGAARVGTAYNPSTGTYARGASTVTPYGTQKVGQAYNPNTGAYGATHQASNAYGSYGSSVVSKNGQSVYTQHQTTSRGTVATAQTSNGNKYAAANGNVYKNTGNGWEQHSNSNGWGQQARSSGSSAFNSEGGGWQSRQASARGASSWGGGGGWGGRGGRR